MALVETENSIVYSGEEQEVSYQLYDILWSDGKATQEVRPVSDGVVPIGLCVIPTNWLDEGEKARFVSLKYMNASNYKEGGLTSPALMWGLPYGDSYTGVPATNSEDDPIKSCYIPYASKNENNNRDDEFAHYSWTGVKDFYDLRKRENWLYTLNYCRQNPGKYAIGDINGKHNTINISVEGNYCEGSGYIKDMKPCVAQYSPAGTRAGDWYIPAVGELLQFIFRLKSVHNNPSINDKVAEISKIYPQYCVSKYGLYNDNISLWSSNVKDSNYSYLVYHNDNSVNIGTPGRDNNNAVVAFLMR